MDVVSYQTFRPIAASATTPSASTFDFDHGMGPMVVVLGPCGLGSAVPTTYNLRIAMELRVRFPMAQANSSLHQSYAPTSQSFFDDVVSTAEDLGIAAASAVAVGAFAPEAAGMGMAGFAGRAIRRVGRNGPRA